MEGTNMEQIEVNIEKGIPIPPKARTKVGLTDALRRCEVGDSFLIETANRTGMYSIAYNLGVKIVVRKINKQQYRIWRSE